MRVVRILSWSIRAAAMVLCLLTVISFDPWPRKDCRRIAAKAQIANFLMALENYREDVGEYPDDEEGLRALCMKPGVKGWNGPYMEKDIPLDPWGAQYRYRHRNEARPEIISFAGGVDFGQDAISSVGGVK